MKKIIALLLALAMVMSLAACGGKSEPAATEAPKADAPAASDEMTATSKYPFYVQPNNTDGLMLGQHVYLELATEDPSHSGLSISSAFICYEDDGSPYVWAERHGKLEKRTVQVGKVLWGSYYEILSDLSAEDWLAFPYGKNVKAGAPTVESDLSTLYSY